MMIEGMSTVLGAIGKVAAVAALASGLAFASPARADTWQDALRDADDLHDAAEALHERALRLHAHHVLPVTAALDQAAADLYHELKHSPCAVEVVPALNRTKAVLNDASSAIALDHDIHHDRKAIALIKDIRHHLVDTAEHIECVLHDHHHHSAAPTVRYPQPQPSWYAPPFGSQYRPAPAWTGHPSSPATWGSGYRGPSHDHSSHNSHNSHNSHSGHQDQHYNKLPRVLLSEILAR